LAQLGGDLTSIPRLTDQEKAIGEFILNWFEANGLRAVRQEGGINRQESTHREWDQRLQHPAG